MEEVHQQAWDAAWEAWNEENDEDSFDDEAAKTLICIGIHSGISSGLGHCDVVENTSTWAAEHEDIDDDEAAQWADEAIHEVYSDWWTSYDEICTDNQDSGNGDNSGNGEGEEQQESNHPCKESDEAYNAWNDALTQSRNEPGTDRFDRWLAGWMAAADALDGDDGDDEVDDDNNSDKLTCIGVQLGITTGMTHCEIIETIVSHSEGEGVSSEQAYLWADSALNAMWPWYSTYEEMC